jgi:broad specificity phosphatase PhoE
MPAVFFITHPDVAIDPSIPVADWPLNARGRARMQAMSASPWASGVRRIFSSSERKARDAAQFLADGLGLHGYSVVDGLGENDRSATGYLAQQEFEATVDAFFAQPQTSIRGWETAVDAQARIVHAVEQVISQASDDGNVAIIGHGDAALLPSRRTADQPASRAARNKWWKLVRLRSVSRKLLHVGWRSSYRTPL